MSKKNDRNNNNNNNQLKEKTGELFLNKANKKDEKEEI